MGGGETQIARRCVLTEQAVRTLLSRLRMLLPDSQHWASWHGCSGCTLRTASPSASGRPTAGQLKELAANGGVASPVEACAAPLSCRPAPGAPAPAAFPAIGVRIPAAGARAPSGRRRGLPPPPAPPGPEACNQCPAAHCLLGARRRRQLLQALHRGGRVRGQRWGCGVSGGASRRAGLATCAQGRAAGSADESDAEAKSIA